MTGYLGFDIPNRGKDCPLRLRVHIGSEANAVFSTVSIVSGHSVAKVDSCLHIAHNAKNLSSFPHESSVWLPALMANARLTIKLAVHKNYLKAILLLFHKKERQCTYNVTVRLVRVTILALKTQ